MPPIDPKSIAGKFQRPAEHVALGIVGAGKAGIAAAVKAMEADIAVLLIDENPVGGGLMGLDVPLFYGNRMTAAVQRPERMMEQVFAAEPGLAEAMELGVDVRLGVTAWGAFANGPNLQALPGPVLGLADEQRSWMCGFDRLVVAAGARDLVFFFPGADQPGVMGAQALHSLIDRYDAFSGRRIVLLGSGDLALKTALLALDRGLDVVALVEPRSVPQGSESLIAALRSRGVPIMTSHVVQSASGTADGVTAVALAPLDEALAVSGPSVSLACDTLCVAVDLVPNIELLSVLGCRIVFDGPRGGYVPVVGVHGETSLPGVSAVGDCAGLEPEAGRMAYRLDWMRALLAAGGLAPLACQCEEVTRAEVLGVRPPRYLGWGADKPDPRSVAALADGAVPHPDQLKRLTRAGMGTCQGRRCREQIALLLSVATNQPLERIPLASYRAPVRPLPLNILAPTDESQELLDNWDVWFGIPGQWVPYRDIGTEREHQASAENWHL